MHLIYDVSNRESFEALPRWLEELENYVPPEVVKIVVGNKLDKVMSSPLLSSPPSFPVDR
jgi:Ras-related protein Rab-18